jgi:hypothetical protein
VKGIILGLLLVGASIARAENPPYYATAKGLMLPAMFQQNDLTIDFGTLKDCVKKPVTGGPLFISYRCKSDVKLRIVDDKGVAHEFGFTRLDAFVKGLKDDQVAQEYHFGGMWATKDPMPLASKTELVLVSYMSNPKLLKGWFKLPDLGTTGSIVAEGVSLR